MSVPKIPISLLGGLRPKDEALDKDRSQDLDMEELRTTTPEIQADIFVQVVQQSLPLGDTLRLWVSQMQDPLSVRKQILSQMNVPSLSDMQFGDKRLPGLFVHYAGEHHYGWVPGLSREEGERELIFFAGLGKEGKVDKEEFWVLVEGVAKGKPSTYWMESGEDETPEGVVPDLGYIIEAEANLRFSGMEVYKMACYHIHPKDGLLTDVYGFSPHDVALTPSFQSLEYDGKLEVENRIVTPAGVYVIRPKQNVGESRDKFLDRFFEGVNLFMEHHMDLRKEFLSGKIPFAQGSLLFAQNLNRLLAEEMGKEPPFSVAFHHY